MRLRPGCPEQLESDGKSQRERAVRPADEFPDAGHRAQTVDELAGRGLQLHHEVEISNDLAPSPNAPGDLSTAHAGYLRQYASEGTSLLTGVVEKAKLTHLSDELDPLQNPQRGAWAESRQVRETALPGCLLQLS